MPPRQPRRHRVALHDVEAWKKNRIQEEKQFHGAEKALYGAWFKTSGIHWRNEVAMTKLIEKGQTRNLDISAPIAQMGSQKQLRAALDRIGKKIEESTAPASLAKTIFQS